MESAQSGDPAALDQLLAAIRPSVLGRCRKFLPYNDDAEEAAQDALLAIATKLPGYEHRGSFLGWVTVVTSNSARQTYRNLVGRSRERAVDVLPDQVDPRRTSVVAGTRLDLLDAVEALEQQLPVTAEPFVLRDVAALPYEEIARLTDTPLGTVKDRIHRAREFVRHVLR